MTQPGRITLDSLRENLHETMARLRTLRQEQADYIVFGNNEHCPAVKRLVQREYLVLMHEIEGSRTNEQQRDALLTERLEAMGVYQAQLTTQRQVATMVQELLDEIELTRLTLQCELALMRGVSDAIRD